MLTKTKMAIIAAFVFGSASGAMAQSYDPDIGTGNIVLVSGQNLLAHVDRGPLGAHAQVPTSIMPRGTAGSVLPFGNGYQWPYYDAVGNLVDPSLVMPVR
jgi:hypothetical protein